MIGATHEVRRLAAAALFLWLVATAAHGAQPKPLGGFTTRLDDKVENLPDERVRWSTDWVLCWKPQPKAVAYEVQVSTSEGYSRNAKRIETTCHRVEVAKDEGPSAEMANRRAMQLAMTSSMVGYRVRGVLKDGSVTPWSQVFPAAELIPARKRGK